MASSSCWPNRAHVPSSNEHRITIDLNENSDADSDDTMLGDEYEEELVEALPEVRLNVPIQDPNIKQIPFFKSDSGHLKPGKTVELRDKDFLQITAILQHQVTTEVTLQGVRFRRNLYLNGLVERKLNEVTMILVFNQNDSRNMLTQSIVAIGLHEVLKVRELIKTNRPFPALSFRETEPSITKFGGTDYTMAHGRLVCRYKQLLISKNEGFLQMLRATEADTGCSWSDDRMRRSFRRETQKGGCSTGWSTGEKDFDRNARAKCKNITLLHFHRHDSVDTNQTKRYTFGDGFCGGGGASCGAKAAGLYVDWGFDFNPSAIDTYKRNFWGARCENTAAHIFATIITEDFKVDILHLSPPCQTFSPMHVHHGKDDEMNEATFFAVEEIIRKVQPRIVTLEETFGLTGTPEKLTWFYALIQVFTKLGFSVRWKVFDLRIFGLPQPRRRLFVMASCPGEPLPDWPEPTHCAAADLPRTPHLLPFSSVNDAIGNIPPGFPLHNPDQVMRRDAIPYDGDLPLRNTITTQGIMSYHPSGKRNFTTRELACLQGVPFEHQFGPSGTRKQIGNMVPPIVAKIFFEHIKHALLKEDGLR